MLRWRSQGELLTIDITCGWEVSGGPVSRPQLSHLRGSSLTPGQSTETVSHMAQRNREEKKKEKKIKLLNKKNY